MIYGNIDGVKKSAIEELDRLYKVKCPKDEVCSIEIIEVISRVSSFIEREVSVAIDRRGSLNRNIRYSWKKISWCKDYSYSSKWNEQLICLRY